MKLIQALPGDSVETFLGNLYRRCSKKEPIIITTFNDVTIILLHDEVGTEHVDCNIDAVTNHYLADILRQEKKEAATQ